MLNRDDLKGMTLSELLEAVERGRVGYGDAMDWLKIESLNELVEIMHYNDREMPGHRPMHIPPETRELLRRITRPLPREAAE
jgi:hypothetical protein